MEADLLRFEGVIGYSAGDDEEAAHFFEHTLGLELGAEDGGLRFYALSEGVTLTVDISGGMAGQPPYLLFSSPRVVEAAEHFLQRGCQVRELPWAPSGRASSRARRRATRSRLSMSRRWTKTRGRSAAPSM